MGFWVWECRVDREGDSPSLPRLHCLPARSRNSRSLASSHKLTNFLNLDGLLGLGMPGGQRRRQPKLASASLFACPIPQLPLLGIQPQTDQLSQPGWAFGFGNAGWTEKETAQACLGFTVCLPDPATPAPWHPATN